MHRRRAINALITFAAGAFTNSIWAQSTYPNKPVRIVVAVPAGGSIDMVARAVAEKLGEALGQPFIVENRAGGAGIIGTDFVAKSTADGYVLTMAPAAFIASHVSTFAKLSYDPIRDFLPVIQVVTQPSVLIVNPSSLYTTVAKLVDIGRVNPGKLNYGSGGDGSPHHLSGVMFSQITGTTMTHIAYKGGAPALIDLLGGQIDMIFAPVPEALPHIKAGKLRALAVMNSDRSGVLPEVPTMSQAGLKGLELTTWIGLLAPNGTPKDVVYKLNAAVQKALTEGGLKERFSEVGLDTAGGTPEKFAEIVKKDISTYAKLVRASGMIPQ
jgi:tripartite-type tricarboxylate transporter receptor subunit TctC